MTGPRPCGNPKCRKAIGGNAHAGLKYCCVGCREIARTARRDTKRGHISVPAETYAIIAAGARQLGMSVPAFTDALIRRTLTRGAVTS